MVKPRGKDAEGFPTNYVATGSKVEGNLCMRRRREIVRCGGGGPFCAQLKKQAFVLLAERQEHVPTG